MSEPPAEDRLKVFISYTRESVEHDSRVLNLANRIITDLRFDCDIDQFYSNQDWPHWMEDRIEWADRVLIIATPMYLERWMRREKKGVGLGAKWESMLTRQHLYEMEGNNEKYVPVIFQSDHSAFIPKPLRGFTRVLITDDDSLEQLRQRLLGIPPATKPSLPPVTPAFKSEVPYFPDMALPSGPKPRSREQNARSFAQSLPGIVSKSEVLTSNIFPIAYSPVIYRARLPRRKGLKAFRSDVESAWKASGHTSPPPNDYVLDGNTVFRLKPFSKEPWQSMVQGRRLVLQSEMPTTDWAHSQRLAEKNLFIKLLNGCLTELCRSHDMKYSRDMGCYLFVRGTQRSRFVTLKAIERAGTREICKAIPDKNSQDPNAVLHWQHQAFRHRFVRFGLNWFIVITPFWAFTSDGYAAKSRFQNSWSAKLRKPERNRAVLGHILLWRSVLCRDPDMLRRYEDFRIEAPAAVDVAPSIIDQEWIAFSRGEERADLEADLETSE